MHVQVLFLAFTPVALAQVDEHGCTITANTCQNFPEFQRTQFRDILGEAYFGTSTNEAACLKRAEDFHHWCGNSAHSGAQIAATYNQHQLSQVYHPSACDKGWSQWDAYCYKQNWEKKNWFEAEKHCRDQNSHLASIHSQAENRFVFSLTFGVSSWIGYTDLDQDTHYKWSDNTQDDCSNFAKNCTGRENDLDCQPQERQQQWFAWEGSDVGTYVCKKNALLPIALLQNTTAKDLIEMPWNLLLPVLALNTDLVVEKACVSCVPVADAQWLMPESKVPGLKIPSVPKVTPVTAAVRALKRPGMLEPQIIMPQGSLKLL